MDASTTVMLSTSDVDGRDAAAYWRDLVCSAFVEVAVRPAEEDGFAGVVTHRDVAGIGFVRLASQGQQVDRTKGCVARSTEHHLLANIQIRGQGFLAQDGRSAVLTPGSLAFVDSARPYTMHFGDEFAQLVVRFPVSMLSRRTLKDATSTALDGPARLVTDFLLGLENLDPAAAPELVPHTLGLVDTALGWAAGRTVGEQSAVTRERVHRFVRENAGNPELDADAVAAGCRVSRRTLFRALSDDEPLTSLLRRIRVERAQQMLRSNPRLPITAVAQQCGFAGAAQLHRAFQRVTGGTPGDHRRRAATFSTN